MPNLRAGDKISICGEEYELVRNLSGSYKGFQFRTWLVKNTSNGKQLVAKITKLRKRALNELRAYIYLWKKRYPERYYAELEGFDYEARHVRSKNYFYVILLKYLPEEKFQSLDEYLKRGLDDRTKRKIASKLRRRVRKLHELGMSHGDIRDANIMVKENGGRIGVRLIDFGSSKFRDKNEIQKDNKDVEGIIAKIRGQG